MGDPPLRTKLVGSTSDVQRVLSPSGDQHSETSKTSLKVNQEQLQKTQ